MTLQGHCQRILRRRWLHADAHMTRQAKQGVFQRLGQVRLRHHPHVGNYEGPVQKAANQRRVLRRQQAPRRVLTAQGVESGVVQINERLPGRKFA